MSDHGYLRFARANARFLGFGFTMAFASSVGQTFFIGVFGPAVRGEFGLSHTSWSAIYMAGTLLSAAALTWTGPQIDRLPLKRYPAQQDSLLTSFSKVCAASLRPSTVVR